MVAMYKKLRSIRLLKNNVIKPLHTKIIRSTDGSLSFCAIRTDNNVGILAKCNNIIVSQPRV